MQRVEDAISDQPQDDSQLYAIASAKLNAAAAQSDLTARAAENTRSMLTGMAKSFGYDAVTVTFDPPAPPAAPPQRFATRDGERYICQSTELLAATAPLSRWAVAAYARDVWAGEVRLTDFLALVWRTLRRRLSRGGAADTILGENPHPSRGDLALTAGDIVRVKSALEIARELDPQGKNKGLGFVPTMLPAIDKQYEVAFPIRKMILEKTGKMIPLANTVVLKGIQCGGPCVANCPRSSDLYWRESWLEKLVDTPAPKQPDAAGAQGADGTTVTITRR